MGDSLYKKYRKLYDYFDDWGVVNVADDYSRITGFVLKPQMGDERPETISW